MKDYGEPWALGVVSYGCDSFSFRMATRDGTAVRFGWADWDRIAACVNAMAGVPHPEKLPELLAACKAVKLDTDIEPDERLSFEVLLRFRAALSALYEDGK